MPDYVIRKSPRARHLRITVKTDGMVLVTVPARMSERTGHAFAERKREWIEKALAKVRNRPKPICAVPKGNTRDYASYKDTALSLVTSRLEHFNVTYGFAWNRVTIKNTSSRWGSCSKQGNLNFSYRLLFLPQELSDYVVVHELCHLEELNHSPAFWKLVEQTIPDYRAVRKNVRTL